MKFKIGQAVACAHALSTAQIIALRYNFGVTDFPVVSKRYTIRGGKVCEPCNLVGYLLEEVKNPDEQKGAHCPYSAGEFHFPEWMFRPIVDVSAFDEEIKRLSDPTKWTQEDRDRILGDEPVRVLEPEDVG